MWKKVFIAVSWEKFLTCSFETNLGATKQKKGKAVFLCHVYTQKERKKTRKKKTRKGKSKKKLCGEERGD